MTKAAPISFTDLDKQRLSAWFEHDPRLPDLANELNTSVLELAQWARQPHIAEALDAIATVARQRNATLRAEAQHAATARLLRIVRFCDHDEVARRAADRLLRSLPAGERPLYDEPEHLTDKAVHAQPSKPRPSVPLPSIRTPAIDTGPASERIRPPLPAAPTAPPTAPAAHAPNPPRTSRVRLTSKPTLIQVVAAIIDAADRSGIDLQDLDAPGFLDDLLDELNLKSEASAEELQEAINNALLVRATAPP